MRTRSTARRSIALLATTALMTGGLATGMLASPAYAAPGDPVHLLSSDVAAWDNRSTATLRLTGTNFINGDPTGQLNDEVDLVPVAGLADATNEVATIVAFVDPATPPNAGVANVSIPLAMAPPGQYRLSVVHADGTPSDNTLPFSIYAFGPANASSVAFGPNASTAAADARGAGPLDIRGSNFAVGAKVAFLKSDLTADTGLTFRQGNPGNDTNPIGTQAADGKDNDSGYPSATLLQGNYSYALKGDGTNDFVPGLHSLRVYNTDETVPPVAPAKSGTTTLFAQPYYAPSGAVSPASVGVGAQSVTVTVTGQGIRAGSTLGVQKLGPNTCADVSVGPSTVSNSDGNGTFTTISAPVSFASCSATTARSISINGPDGGVFSRGSQLGVGGAPHVTDIESTYSTLGQGAKVGYGSDGVWQAGEGVVVNGTNFAGHGDANPAHWVTFDFGPHVTVVTRSVGNGSALVTIDVDDDAAAGERTVRATNPDGGSTTTSKPPVTQDPLGVAPFIVEAGPKADKVTPPGFDPSQAGTGVTVTGTFDTSHTYTVSVNRPVGTVNISGVSTPNATTLTFSMSTNNASPGPMDLTITDAGNFGRDVCESCMGINSLVVTAVNAVPVLPGQGSAPNTGPATLQVDGTDALNAPLTSGASATATLTRQVPLAGQGPIAGTAVTPATANRVSATFDLTRAAPGRYSLAIVDPVSSKSWTCTGCFTVASAGNITVTKFEPANAGQGATGRTISVEGTNFANGMTVTMPDGVTVRNLVMDPAAPTTKFTFQVDVLDNAPTGAFTAVIAAGDGSNPGTPTGSQVSKAFAVNPKPAGVADVTPATYAQGAGSNGTPVPLTLTADPGTLQSGAVVTITPGITVTTTGVTPGCTFPDDVLSGCTQTTPDELAATMVIAQNVAADKYALTVTNPDGGAATVPDAFTVAAGPQVASFANDKGQPVLTPDGADHTVTVLGSGFVTSPKTVVAFLKFNGTSWVADDKLTYDASTATVEAGKITLTVKTATDAVLAARRITVTNSDALKGFGSCDTCAAVAKAPSAVSSLTLTGGAQSITATWGAATPNGSPISGYKVTLLAPGSSTPTVAVVPVALPRTHTFPGLVNGVTYTVSVLAQNGAGPGPATTKTAVAGLPSALTVKVVTNPGVYGSPFYVTGKLTSNGVGVGGKTLILTFVPSVGKSYVRTVTTVGSGTTKGQYVYKTTSPYTVRVKAQLVPNDATYRPVGTSYVTETIRVLVKKTAPASSSRSGYTTTLKITGAVGPNKKGTYAYLYRIVSGKNSFVQRVVISSTSTFVFTIKPGRGTYTFHVYVPPTTGNAANYSPAFTLYRV